MDKLVPILKQKTTQNAIATFIAGVLIAWKIDISELDVQQIIGGVVALASVIYGVSTKNETPKEGDK